MASHKQTTALLQTDAAQNLRMEIRERVKLEQRMQRFVAEMQEGSVRCLPMSSDVFLLRSQDIPSVNQVIPSLVSTLFELYMWRLCSLGCNS